MVWPSEKVRYTPTLHLPTSRLWSQLLHKIPAHAQEGGGRRAQDQEKEQPSSESRRPRSLHRDGGQGHGAGGGRGKSFADWGMLALLFVLQSDLFQWSAVLDVIDAELTKKGEEYDRALHLSLLRFTRSLLENCSNRHVYNSYEVRLDRSMPQRLPPLPSFSLAPLPPPFPAALDFPHSSRCHRAQDEHVRAPPPFVDLISPPSPSDPLPPPFPYSILLLLLNPRTGRSSFLSFVC